MPARCLHHDAWPVIRGSFDGLNEDERRAVEIKCPGRKDHLVALKGAIPKKYLWQCVHLLLVTGYKKIDYFSYNPGFKGPKEALVTLTRSNRLEQTLIESEKEWWNYFITDTPPPPGKKEIPWPWPRYVNPKTGENMKSRKPIDNAGLSARELSDLLEKAKELGVISLKIKGLEFAFDEQGRPCDENHEPIDMNRGRRAFIPPSRAARPVCRDCGSEKVPSKQGRGFYCVTCYIDRKERGN